MAPAWEITPTPSAVTDRPADQEVRFTYRVLSVWGHGTFDKSQFSLFRKHFGLFSPGNPQIPVNHRGKTDRTTIIYNRHVTISGIPEGAERYLLGSRTALAWLIDRYQVKTDKASGIVNDPNDWADEHDDHLYIVNLIAKVTRVAVETMEIVDQIATNSEFVDGAS